MAVFFQMCEKCYRKSCKYMRNKSVFCLPWFTGLRGNPYGSRKALTPGIAFRWIELEQLVMY